MNSAHSAVATPDMKASFRRGLRVMSVLTTPESLLQLAEGADLRAGDGVVAGQGVGSVGEGHGLAFAVLGDGIVNGGLGQAVNGIVAAEYTFK